MSDITGPTNLESEHDPVTLNDTIKDTIESILIAFVLAFVFRAYVVEAFVIPTGSMAPTLLGAHVTVACAECGYRFNVDVPEAVFRGISRKGSNPAVCPMCGYLTVVNKPGTTVSSGDRILVHKYIYSVVDPTRWDVVVFKAPHMPDTNFIKRLVGLPQEKLMIVEGNIYTSSTDPNAEEDTRKWHVERKSLRPKVQRAIWQPVYHSDRVPLDGGDAQDQVQRREPWQRAWVPLEGRWDMQSGHDYRCKDPAGGVVGFQFEGLAGFPRYAYNQFKGVNQNFDREAVEDVRVAATIQAESAGMGAALSTTARWGALNGSRPVRIAGVIEADGKARLELTDEVDPATGKAMVLAEGEVGVFEPGRARAVEIWYVDQEMSLWVDGEVVLKKGFDLDFDVLKRRDALPLGYTPTISIRVTGSKAVLHRVNVDRDLYYSSSNQGVGALGGIVKNGSVRVGEPVSIEADQFFCLGDNSPLSNDSRYWDHVDDWVVERMLKDHRLRVGVVPRDLMIGRAFFVYWPAVHKNLIIPNFGDMRFIR